MLSLSAIIYPEFNSSLHQTDWISPRPECLWNLVPGLCVFRLTRWEEVMWPVTCSGGSEAGLWRLQSPAHTHTSPPWPKPKPESHLTPETRSGSEGAWRCPDTQRSGVFSLNDHRKRLNINTTFYFVSVTFYLNSSFYLHLIFMRIKPDCHASAVIDRRLSHSQTQFVRWGRGLWCSPAEVETEKVVSCCFCLNFFSNAGSAGAGCWTGITGTNWEHWDTRRGRCSGFTCSLNVCVLNPPAVSARLAASHSPSLGLAPLLCPGWRNKGLKEGETQENLHKGSDQFSESTLSFQVSLWTFFCSTSEASILEPVPVLRAPPHGLPPAPRFSLGFEQIWRLRAPMRRARPENEPSWRSLITDR